MSGLTEDDTPHDPQDDLPPPPEGPGLFGDVLAPAAPPAPTPLVETPVGAPPSLIDAAAAPEATAAYRVLARKYRPKSFDDMIGQEVMVRILRNAFSLGRIAHAFMLTGVRGVGKTTTARIIARCLNCVGPDGTGGPTADPCGVCPNCTAILADRHPDVLEMDAASRTGVDDVREIIESTRFRPMQARAKVFIIDEVHMLSRNAFNALLKTLEEPPPHVKFIFATTEIRKVPVTVLSRCQRFDLRRISMGEMATYFGGIARKEGVALSQGALELIARAADGSARDGLSLLDQAIAQHGTEGEIAAEAVSDMLGLADRTAVFDLMDAVMAGKPAEALAITDQAHARGADLGMLLQDLLELTHTLTRLKAVPGLRDSSDLPEAERVRGAALADKLGVAVLGRAWQMLLKGSAEVEMATDRRAATEMVLIRLCHVAELPPPGELVRKLMAQGAGAGSGAPAGGGSGGGGVRAVANGGAVMTHAVAAPAPAAPPPPRLTSYRDVAALVQERQEAMLHAHLLHNVHVVRFAPPVIEFRPTPDAPRDLAPRLAALLAEATGTRWTIALSKEQGLPTLASQGDTQEAERKVVATEHPLVQAILTAFPGATVDTVRDANVDAYYRLALNPPQEIALGEPDMPEFAPLEAVPADERAPDDD